MQLCRREATISEINWLERDRWSTIPGSTRLPTSGAHSAGAVAPLAARFERQDGNLVLVVTIRAHEAEHGALISVPAPGETVRLRIPPGTTSGRMFRLPRANAPAPDGFGDLVVSVQIG
jgi:molecular chaperone DnaJ